LSGNPTPVFINKALTLLGDLKTKLQTIQTSLSAISLPANSATSERAVVNGIINTFIERKYDKALDMFLKCELAELLQIDLQTASYGGSLLKSMSDFAQSNIRFPNKQNDEEEIIKVT
jgi:hypothetical protein